MASTSAGTTVSVTTSPTDADTVAELSALTYTEIGNVESLGEVGPQANDSAVTLLKGGVQHLKGALDNGVLPIVYAHDALDPGQIAVTAAMITKMEYGVKIILSPDADTGEPGAVFLARGPIMSARTNIGAANDVRKRTANVGLNFFGEAAPIELSGTPDDAIVGEAYSFTPTVTGGAGLRVFSISPALPAGLSLNTSTGAITGEPEEAGEYEGTLTVTDETGSDTLPIALTTGVVADVVVYGATPGGITAAYEAKRQGRSVIIVGGWREKHLGGMMSGGLGGTDVVNGAAIGGLTRDIFRRIRTAQGAGFDGTSWVFEPRFASQVFAEMLAEQDIDFVPMTGGIVSCAKSGARIQSITTADGATYTGRVFVDASYEGDLLAMAGVSYNIGREASATGESLNGYRGVQTSSKSDGHQFALGSTFYNISPYLTEGDAGSGLLPGLVVHPVSANGAANDRVQAYNFRMVMTNSASRRVDLPSTPPAGYNPQNFELLFRFLAALTADGKVYGTHYTMSDLFLFNIIGANMFDVNNKGGFSTDLIGGSHAYPEASYAARETIWKAHETHCRGLWYALQYADDARVPAALRTAARTYGLDINHYLDPYPGDEQHWMTNLYVREARRMQSAIVWRGADVAAANGTIPRSTKTISTISYQTDSHHVQRLADTSTGTPRVWNEGNFQVDTGGADFLAPIPYDLVVPVESECDNLLVTFCVSSTHQAFGVIRMEFTHMQIGQSCGMAAAIACEDDIAVQDVDYEGDLRPRLLATPEPTPPVLPQVN